MALSEILDLAGRKLFVASHKFYPCDQPPHSMLTHKKSQLLYHQDMFYKLFPFLFQTLLHGSDDPIDLHVQRIAKELQYSPILFWFYFEWNGLFVLLVFL